MHGANVRMMYGVNASRCHDLLQTRAPLRCHALLLTRAPPRCHPLLLTRAPPRCHALLPTRAPPRCLLLALCALKDDDCGDGADKRSTNLKPDAVVTKGRLTKAMGDPKPNASNAKHTDTASVNLEFDSYSQAAFDKSLKSTQQWKRSQGASFQSGIFDLPSDKDDGPNSSDPAVQTSPKKRKASVQEKLEKERRRLESSQMAQPDKVPPDVADLLQKRTTDSSQLSKMIGSLSAQSAQLKADDEKKILESASFLKNAIQKHVPDSTNFTLLLSLTGNAAIATAKFYAYSRTGHNAMFTEAIHTCVDVANQAMLGYGLREASKAPDSLYQYGYGRSAFFYSLLSALTTFGVGAVYTFYQGVDVLLHPPELHDPTIETWSVLALSLGIDGFVLRTAMKNVKEQAKASQVSMKDWIFQFKDPFTVSIIFEDSAAVLGVLFATAGIGLAQVTGKYQLLPPAPPYYPFPRGNIHTRGNIWSFTVG